MRTNRRVTFFGPYPHIYGGAERVVTLLASGLADRGWATRVVVPGDGVFADRLRADGIPVVVVPAPAALGLYGKVATHGSGARRAAMALPRYWVRLSRELASEGGVIHTISQRGVLLAGPAARLARTPLVWNVGGVEPSRVLNAFGSIIARTVVPASVSVAADAPGLVHRRIREVVPNAVDQRLIDGPVASPGSRPEVVCASRLTPEKGIDVLIRAIAHVRERVPEVRLVILGGTQEGHERYRADLEQLRDDLGLTDAVVFAGYVEDPASRWSASWAYAQPSHTEGFGLGVAEAMTCGLPVVASRVGGLAELIDDDRTGLLVPPGDPAALAAALTRVLTDRAVAARLAAAARAHAMVTFAPDRFLDQMEVVYSRIARPLE